MVTAHTPIPREGSAISEEWHSPAGLASQDPCSGTSLTPPPAPQVSDVPAPSTTSFTALTRMCGLVVYVLRIRVSCTSLSQVKAYLFYVYGPLCGVASTPFRAQGRK